MEDATFFKDETEKRNFLILLNNSFNVNEGTLNKDSVENLKKTLKEKLDNLSDATLIELCSLLLEMD